MQNVLKVKRVHGNFFDTRLRKVIIVCIIVCGHICVSTTTFAGDLTVPNTFVSGEVASASDMNDNFTAVETAVDDNDSRITAIEASLDTIALSVIVRTYEGTCPSGSSCSHSADCEPGEILTGGGFDLSEPGAGLLELWTSKPEGNGWSVTCKNNEGVDIDYTFYAVCATITN